MNVTSIAAFLHPMHEISNYDLDVGIPTQAKDRE
jgi:hypothetical protein